MGSFPPQEATLSTWVCPACAVPCEQRYCTRCGEKRIEPHDLTLAGLLGHAAELLTHVDGRVLRSVKDLFVHPGLLTRAYIEGPRRRYFAPFQLFLLANVLFFLVQAGIGFQTLSNSLSSHIGEHSVGSQVYGPLAKPLLERRLVATGRRLEDYRPVFDHAVRVNAKLLAVVLVLPFALIAVATYPGRRRPLIVHVVFAVHFVAFFLLLSSVLLPLVGLPLGAVLRYTHVPENWDPIISLLLLAILGTYWCLAARRVYRVPLALAGAKTLVLLAALFPTIIAYRFVVFLVTLYTT